MAKKKPSNDKLFHYCPEATFEIILQNKTLRLSDITKSNDTAELKWITRVIQPAFDAAYKAARSKKFYNKIDQATWDYLVEHSVKDWFDDQYRYYSYYVLCFSTEDDLLSQWRGYADDAQGISIGFDIKTLKKTTSGREGVLDLKKVVYSNPNQRSAVRRIADQFIKTLKADINSGDFDKKVKELEDSYRKQGLRTIVTPVNGLMMQYFNSIFNEIFDNAVVFKNPFFREEKETRLCYRVSNDHDSKVKDMLNDYAYFMPFGVTKKGQSYVDLCFEDGVKKGLPIISSVTLGPKCKKTEGDIKALLTKNGFEIAKIDVNKSKGTYV